MVLFGAWKVMSSRKERDARTYNKKGNPKYYIDYENKVRECGHCREYKPFFEFDTTPKGFPITYCRPCKLVRQKKYNDKHNHRYAAQRREQTRIMKQLKG